jgi:hypothetical protein
VWFDYLPVVVLPSMSAVTIQLSRKNPAHPEGMPGSIAWLSVSIWGNNIRHDHIFQVFQLLNSLTPGHDIAVVTG